MPVDRKGSEVFVGDVALRSPLIIASGTWPHGPEYWRSPVTTGVGAACTKALTLHPRTGNPGIRVWETPCGLLNSIGLQNPGLGQFLMIDLPSLSSGDVEVVVNVAMETEEETGKVLAALSEKQHLLGAVELNISCPNVDGGGMAWGSDPVQAARAIRIARGNWKGPLWAKLTPQCGDISLVARAAEDAGADALVVANTWLGMAIDTNSGTPVFSRKYAGLSGPAVFPLSLRLVWEVSSAVGIPVIGCGGVSRVEDVLSMMLAVASAVEIGTFHFTDLSCFSRIEEGFLEYLPVKGYASAMALIGRGKREVD